MKRYLVLISLLLSISFAQQPLTELAPPDSILTINMSYKEHYGESIKADLKALNWEQSTQTIQKLVKILIASNKFPELNDLLFAYESRNEAFSMLGEFCPKLNDQMQFMHKKPEHSGVEILETISMGGFSPVPVVTVLARPVSDNNNLEDLFNAMVSCAGDDLPRLEQDGIAMYIVNDGEDTPFVITFHNGIFIASTDPDNVRTVIRLANGSTEASLADSSIYKQAYAELGSYKNSLRVSLDFAAIADIVDSFGGIFAHSNDDRAALNRLLSVLYTLGGNVYQVSAIPEGILTENLVAVNPDGGDQALLRLINCPSCQVLNPPILAPTDSIAINMSYLPWRQSFNYLQSVLNDIANIYSESADIKELSQMFLGLDLDTALFNWLGSEVHSYTLEPISPNAKTMLNGPAQATIIPVTSVEQAKQGISELSEFFIPLINQLVNSNSDGPLGFLNELGLATDTPFYTMPTEFRANFGGEFSIREYSYKNISIQRIQNSLNTDFAYAFIGNNLVISSPASALEKIIDTSESGLNIYNNVNFRLAKQSMPMGSSSFSYSEANANLNGLADVLDLLVQPLAYVINQFLNLKLADSTVYTDDYINMPIDDSIDVFDADIAGISPYGTISSIDGTSASLTTNDIDNYGYYSHYYRLDNIANPGDTVNLMLTSPNFDTQLWLVDANREVYILGNDDMDDISTDSSISFTYEEGNDYWLEVSSFNGDGLGEYQLHLAINEDFVAMQGQTGTAATAANAVTTNATTDEYLEADLTNMTAQSITIPRDIVFNLDGGQVDNYDSTTVFYSLEGLTAGDIVKISLSSDAFDTRLWLVDTTNNYYLADNDDIDDTTTNSGLVFKAQEGISYWLEVSSYDSDTSGEYSLSLNFGTEADLAAFIASSNINSEGEVIEANLTNMHASNINIGDIVSGTLKDSEVDNYGYITDFYEIQGLTAGDEIVIDLYSDDFDAQLWLADTTNNIYLLDNDDVDENSLNSQIGFIAEEGINYWIEVSSSSASEIATGNYDLSVSYAFMTTETPKVIDMPVDDYSYDTELTVEDIPSFKALLDLLDLLPNSIRVLSKHISTDVSYTKTTNSNIYSREILHIDW